MEYRLTTPCTAQDLAPLKAGDTVLLSGVVYTARDQAHKRMIEALDKGEALPFDLTGSAIYYVGPTPERPGEVIGSAGPTTSGRMDAMSPRLLDLGNKITVSFRGQLALDNPKRRQLIHIALYVARRDSRRARNLRDLRAPLSNCLHDRIILLGIAALLQ